MCTAKTPWAECGFDNQIAFLYHIGRTTVPPEMPQPPKVSPGLHHFMAQCLRVRPDERPSCAELQRDKFVSSRKILHKDLQGGEVRLEREGPPAKRRKDNAGGAVPCGDVGGGDMDSMFGSTVGGTMLDGDAVSPPPNHSRYLHELSQQQAHADGGDGFMRSKSAADGHTLAPTGLTAAFDALNPL